MQFVDNFVQLLLASEELKSFTRARIYLDEDFSESDKFTVSTAIHYLLNR